MTNEKFKEWLKSLDDKQLHRVLAAVNGEMLTRAFKEVKDSIDNNQEVHTSTFSRKEFNDSMKDATFDDPYAVILRKFCQRLAALERDIAILKMEQGLRPNPFKWYPDIVIY